MRVAALQFDVRRGEVDANLAAVERGLERAADGGVELVVLPEMWPTSFVHPESAEDAVLEAGRRAVERVRERSAALGLHVCGSSFAAAEDGAPPYNRLVLAGRGRELLSYDKVHLFSPTGEQETFSAGRRPPPTADLELGGANWRVSGQVCYDLRFPEVARASFRAGAELLLVSAQWPAPRAAHWRALVAARAIEGQAFVVAANRTGSDEHGRRRLLLEFPGGSRIVDPHGRVLAEGGAGEELVTADLDLAVARDVRRRVPVAEDERRELYRTW